VNGAKKEAIFIWLGPVHAAWGIISPTNKRRVTERITAINSLTSLSRTIGIYSAAKLLHNSNVTSNQWWLDTIDRKFIQNLLTKGFSRIPVYLNDRDNIIGILRIKQLIGIDISRQKTIKDLKITLSSPLIISKNMLAMDLMTEFRKGRSHMAFITESANVEKLQKRLGLDKNNSLRDTSVLSKLEQTDSKRNYVKILGIVTIEDVIEKMFNIEILDEDDYNKGKKKENLKKVLTRQITQSFIDKKKSLLNDMIEHSNKDTIIEENNPYTLYEGYDEYKDEKQKDYMI